MDETGQPQPKLERFEDLIVWQRARRLTKRIYLLTRDQIFAHDRSMAYQIQRCCVSIMANIAEGFGRRGSGEFGHFLSISLGSCAEAKSHFYVLFDCELISEEQMKDLYNEVDEIARMLTSLLRSSVAAKSKAK